MTPLSYPLSLAHLEKKKKKHREKEKEKVEYVNSRIASMIPFAL